jgi:hypothetical protein
VAYVELLTLSVWTSQDALDEFGGDESAEVSPISDGVIQLEHHNYEVVLLRTAES